MTDTSQLPEGGQPERAGARPEEPAPPAQSGVLVAAPAYPFPEPAEEPGDGEDEDLLMPPASGAWGDGVLAAPQPTPEQPAARPEAGAAPTSATPPAGTAPGAIPVPPPLVPAGMPVPPAPVPPAPSAAAPTVPAPSAATPPASATPPQGTPAPAAPAAVAVPSTVPPVTSATPPQGTPVPAAPAAAVPSATPTVTPPATSATPPQGTPTPAAPVAVPPVTSATPPQGTPVAAAAAAPAVTSTPAHGTPAPVPEQLAPPAAVAPEPPAPTTPEEPANGEGAPPAEAVAPGTPPHGTPTQTPPVGTPEPAVPTQAATPAVEPTAPTGTPPQGTPTPQPTPAATPPHGTPVAAAPPAPPAPGATATPAHGTPAAGVAVEPVPAAAPAASAPVAPEPVAVAPPQAGDAATEPSAAPATPPEPAAAPGESAGPPEAAPTPPQLTAVPVQAGAWQSPAPAFPAAEREAVHRLMRERRDVREGFRPDAIPNDVLLRVLEAAHTAPTVGVSEPWDFVIIRSPETRQAVHELAARQREAYARSLPKARARQFKELKVEAILDTPVNIVVTADPTRGGRPAHDPRTQPQMAPYSAARAVENLWLAARAEGLGVGWISFFDERELVGVLDLPDHLEIVAYLCVGYVDEAPQEPEPAPGGAAQRRPLSWVVHEESYGRRALPGAEPHDLLSETLAEIRPLDAQALGEAWERQKRMTKPAGSLGALEVISAQLCGLARSCPPPVPEPAAVAVFAGDHGVHAQGVTAWPQEVTGQMVANFLGGGAVCNAFANQVGAEVCVVDVGVRGELPATPGLMPRKVRAGTADFTVGPAMSRQETLRAVEVGIETARDLVAAGHRALLTGEMGIANTTVSAALIAVFAGAEPAEVTGRGTGIDDETHARKIDAVRRALRLHQPAADDPLGVLAAVGGLEHAALTGFVLGGASLRVPVILDGVSAGAAALAARAMSPEAVSVCIAGHRSAEPGHVAALTALGLRPLVDLDLRLGEGTGALLALPVVQSAARALREVATFDSAGVTDKN
ncbi:nicotinate-nucleotide--dimethylbenzimidazole phosphoribosyltransferase [Streptomyces sp. B6B3]|uniref:nicotinate-nucleotide--dimethylbenzimidazole phosphoribosyltransferase n=1 Tax=Streptomyces sp. B6B3 TaxID=3153570 RepID=UPI00325E64A3